MNEYGQIQVPSLADEINAATQDMHIRINKLIMSRLPLGLKNSAALSEGLLSFSHVYRAFEPMLISYTSQSAPESRIKSMISCVQHDALLRVEQIEGDLLYYNQLDSVPESFKTPDTPARIQVTNTIRKNIQAKPHLLLGYAHVMYMALFAGGSHMRTAIMHAKALNTYLGMIDDKSTKLKEEQTTTTTTTTSYAGTYMFRFPGCDTREQENQLRQSLRDGLRTAETMLTKRERSDIIKEARSIFMYNERLIRELDDICNTPTITTGSISQQKTHSKKRSMVDSLIGGVLLLGAFFWYIIYMIFLKPSLNSLPMDVF